MNIHSNLLIVIATYNEIDNLPRLVARLEELLPDAQVLVIDDNSPDGTGKWCDEASSKHPKLSVVHRDKKLGLGSATLIGFEKALADNYSFVATIDADFSHDPVDLVTLVNALESSNKPPVGVAIGSRYVTDGAIEGWPFFRRLTSRAVNYYARIMLGLNTKDNSGAFRVYRCADLKKIKLSAIQNQGYGYLEEILWRLKRVGVEMIELPIVFRDRERGASKTSPRDGLNVFWQITKLGLSRNRANPD